MEQRILGNLVAEAIGTFTLSFVGILAIYNIGAADTGLIGVALAHGLAILIMVAALGHVSGGHFNPAITIGLLLGKHIRGDHAAMYIVAQLVGATIAGVVIAIGFGTDVVANGTPVLAEGTGMLTAIALEAIATFFLVYTVFGTAVDKRAPAGVYPLAIGLSITAGILAIGPFTGAALNPSRGFGPALVSGEWSAAGAWIIGPIIGGVLAWLVHDFLTNPRAAREAVAESGEHRTD